MGIDKYNAECRAIVMRYSSVRLLSHDAPFGTAPTYSRMCVCIFQEWRDIMTRLGRWIDFDNDYKTMYPWFMESVWWVFKQLFNKNLVYMGYKVRVSCPSLPAL